MHLNRFLLVGAAASASALVAPAQTIAPPLAAPRPAPLAFRADGPTPGSRACQKSHLASRAAVAAYAAARVSSASRRHERLMNRYDVTFARLDLALERTATTLGTGSNVLTTARNRSAAAPLDSIGFELHPSLTLDSVQVNGQRVPTTRVARALTGNVVVRPVVPVASGAAFSYQVWYRGTPTPTGSAAIDGGITSRSSPSWGNRVTWTLSQPNSAYEWWPCKQTLSDKLDSVAVWVTTSAANRAGANGVLEAVTPRPGNKLRYEWKSRYPIAYYLVSVAVAEYVEYTIYARPAALNGDSIPVVNYVYDNPQTLPFWQADIDATVPMIEEFSDKLGLYPFWQEKYGHSMAPLGGGMEHQTMTTQGTFEFDLTAHELMHQWFGDHVTCRSWRDIWLNEGFATYGEYLALQALSPPDAPTWLDATRSDAFAQATGSIAVPDTLDANRIFEYGLTYQKAATVVHMLRHVAGSDSAFFALLRAYQTEFAYSTAVTADLQRVAEQSLGRPLGSLGWFFEQWIAGEGYARTDAGWNQVGTQLIVESNQTATAPAATPFFRMPLEVLVTYAAGGPAPHLFRVEQTQASQRWTLPLPAGATVARLELDPNQWNLLQILRTRRNNALQPTGLAADAATERLNVFPNPCTDRLHLSAIAEARAADVLDLSGRVISRQPIANGSTELSTAALAPGTYVLRLTTDGGHTRQVRFVRK